MELDTDDRQDPGASGSPPFLNVRIRDHRHGVSTGFGERSDGFVWFFSFLVAFAGLRGAEDVILLLDEPGLGLHPPARPTCSATWSSGWPRPTS